MTEGPFVLFVVWSMEIGRRGVFRLVRVEIDNEHFEGVQFGFEDYDFAFGLVQ